MNGAVRCWWIALRFIHPTKDFFYAIVSISVGWMQALAPESTKTSVIQAEEGEEEHPAAGAAIAHTASPAQMARRALLAGDVRRCTGVALLERARGAYAVITYANWEAACGENNKRVGGILFGSGGALSHKNGFCKHKEIPVPTTKAFLLFSLFPFFLTSISFGQDNTITKLEDELVASWLVSVEGQVRTRVLKITKATQKDEETFHLDAIYGWSDGKLVTIKAEVKKVGQERKLIATTQSNAEIIATQIPDGTFTGTFTPKNEKSRKITVVKLSEDELQAVRSFGISEETITTTVPVLTGLFFREEKQVRISGILWTPSGKNISKPYPLVIFSHGAPDSSGIQKYDRLLPAFRVFLTRGYAVFAPLRKGFSRKGLPSSEADAEKSEPLLCNYSSQDQGLQSALSDTKVLYTTMALTKQTDIDLTNVTLAGQSRGGVLSVALAADGLPGVRRILNFSGGWMSEIGHDGAPCDKGFTSHKFEESVKKINVPLLSFYGDNDHLFSLRHVQSILQALEKRGTTSGYILPGGGHSLLWNNPDFWVPIVFSK